MKQIKYLLTAALVILAGLSSCSDEENKSRFDNKAYINNSGKITNLLISDEAGYEATLAVSTAKPVDTDAKFTFRAATDMVATYNEAYYTKAELLPAANYSIKDATVTVAKGSARSTECTVIFKDVNELNRDILYVLPVTVTGDIDLIESSRTHYFAFKAGALINWAANIDRNNFEVNWKKDMSGLNELTYEAWLYLEHIDGDVLEANIRTFMGVEGQFLVRFGDNFEIDQIQVVKTNDNKYPASSGMRTSFPVKKWTHLAVTHSSDNVINVYINGERVSSDNAVSGTMNLNKDFFIGKSYNEKRWWPGMITEARVWTVARTADQIQANMLQLNVADPDNGGLAAYWKFNESEGNTVTDHSGKGNNITSTSPLTWVSIELPEPEE